MDVPFETSSPADSAPDLVVHELQRRVASLEDSVARLEDTQALEERVVARLSDRLPQVKVTADVSSQIVEERILARLSERLPAAADGRASQTAATPPASPPTLPDLTVTVPLFWGGGWASWLFVDMWREARLLWRMILDRRYRMAWTTRLVTLALLPLILLAHVWMPLLFFWFPLMWFDFSAGLCIALVNLALAFAIYKALSREGRRYSDSIHH
jgi:hypothetical protein